jgi:hypothetical protein
VPRSSHQKSRFEALAQDFRLLFQTSEQVVMAESTGEARGCALGSVGITLHLAQRDCAIRKTAVRMKHRVLRVFPALIAEAPLVPSLILDKAVPVAIAIAI